MRTSINDAMRALIATANGFEESELLVPYYRLLEASPGAYELLVVPGGKAAQALATHAAALALVKRYFDSGKPVAAICHGPQLLAGSPRAGRAISRLSCARRSGCCARARATPPILPPPRSEPIPGASQANGMDAGRFDDARERPFPGIEVQAQHELAPAGNAHAETAPRVFGDALEDPHDVQPAPAEEERARVGPLPGLHLDPHAAILHALGNERLIRVKEPGSYFLTAINSTRSAQNTPNGM